MTEGWKGVEDQEIIGQERTEEIGNYDGYNGGKKKTC